LKIHKGGAKGQRLQGTETTQSGTNPRRGKKYAMIEERKDGMIVFGKIKTWGGKVFKKLGAEKRAVQRSGNSPRRKQHSSPGEKS